MMLCGREEELRRIIDYCSADYFVVVQHQPGYGASTLLEKAVKPELVQRNHIVVVWKDWQGRGFVADFKEAIAEAVRRQADDSFFAQPETLDEMVARVRYRTGQTVVLLLDQFEDYVRCHTGSDFSDNFDAELSNAIAGHRCKTILALQDHAVEAFGRFSQFIPDLLGHCVKLSPLSKASALDAVHAEAERRGFYLQPGVAEPLVNCEAVAVKGKGSDPPAVHPFFLMQGITRWLDSEARVKSSMMQAETLAGNGGPDRIVMESLDMLTMDLNMTHLELLFRWCNILISPEKQRLAVSEKGLTDYAGKYNRFVLTGLPLLVNLGVLRSVEMQDVTRYEIARDCYAPIVRDWWERREAFLTSRRRARFRVRSISFAAGLIVAMYVVWLILNARQ